MSMQKAKEAITQDLSDREDLLAACERWKAEAADTLMKLKEKEDQIEQVYAYAHTLAMEAQVARIELNQIFNTASDGVWLIDKKFNVLKVNDALSDLIGQEKNKIVNNKCYKYFSGSLCNKPACALTRIMKGEKIVECDTELAIGGKSKLFILTAVPLLGVDGRTMGIIESFKDITERKKMELALQEANEELKRLTMVDGLTQVANRRRFDDSLNQEWGRMMRDQKPLSLIICDVDFFKRYNDTYGHQMGDHCLRLVAQAISSCTRRAGDTVARYGGEEFAVILPDTSAAGALTVAELIRQEVEKLTIDHCSSEIHRYVTLSLGVSSVVPCPKLGPKALVETADTALYQAKKTGRNRIAFKALDP